MFKEKTDDNLTEKSRVTSAQHDILYSKARYVINQRHIKRPWFNLNPFLEKTVDLADLDKFLPRDSKYIQPPESLVLCESFHCDNPLDTTELAIDAFFKYLHSDKWSNGCSVRVLEGHLLDQLLLGLYRMEHDGTAVRHTTNAFAKNNRKRTGCYNQSTAESLDSIAETLLLEFAYFGKLTKEVPNEKSLDPFEYLHQPDEKVIEIPVEVPSTPETVKAQVGPRRKRATTLSINSHGQAITRPIRGPHGSVMSKHMHAINNVHTLQRHINEKRQSNRSSPPEKNKRLVMSPRTSPESKRNSNSTPPNAARNRRLVCVPEPNGRRHPAATSPFEYCTSQTKRTKPALDYRDMSEVEEDQLSPKASKKGFVSRIYEWDFEDDNISDEGERAGEETEIPLLVKKKEEFFGKEFYLSDNLDDNRKPLSANKKLRLNQIELHKKREEIKAKQKQIRNLKVSILPPLPPLDLTDIDSQNIKLETIDMPDEMPTFEEFIQLLKEDAYYDPRYRNRMRLKSRRIAQRYYIAKGQNRSSVVHSSDVTNINGCKSHKSSVPSVHREEPESARLPALQETAGRIAHAHDKIMANDSCADLAHQSEEVKGVTDSDSCKKHYLQNRKFLNTGNIERPTKKASLTKQEVKGVADSDSYKKHYLQNRKFLNTGNIKLQTKKASLIKQEVKCVTDSDSCKKHYLQNRKFLNTGNIKLQTKKASLIKQEVKGVTDSDSCKKHYLQNRKFLNTGDIELPTKKASLIKAPLVKDTHHSGSNVNSTKHSGVNIKSAKSPALLLTKNSPRRDESEGSDSNSEEDENDDSVSEIFNAKKLNLRYSTEKLKKRRCAPVKKKPAFFGILAKYYNASNTLRVFQKDSPEKDTKSAQVQGSVLGKLMGRAKIKVKQKKALITTIGKLKHFNFCDSKPKKTTSLEYLSRADFTQPDLDTFYLNLKEAVDYFVVRRETVFSDLQTFNSAITSVTFTRKSCFQHKHNECKA